ncbi:MAG: hypothetical protein ACTSXE_05025 [Candidatus Thorarchaeota archaeon]
MPLSLNEGADWVTGWIDGISDDEDPSYVGPATITHIAEGDELLGADDGFDTQREALLRYRVASQALLTLPGREAGIRSDKMEVRAERIEREMEGVKDLLMSSETPIINEVRVVDVGQ